MKFTLAAFAGALAAVILAGCGTATPITSGTPTPAPTITPFVSAEYAVPTANGKPSGVTGAPGSVWFAETNAGKVGFLSSAGTLSDFAVPTINSAPLMITYGVDSNIWFTESAAPSVGRIGVAGGTVTEFQLPNTLARPWGITSGPDGAMWVTDPGANGIWRIQTNGLASFYPLLTANANPTAITTGPNGALWFVESNVDRIGTIAPTAAVGSNPTEFAVTAGAGLTSIASGTDNALWFTESKSDKIGRMLTSGVLSSETPLTGVTTPFALVLAGDGNFYITDSQGSQIVQFSPSNGKVALFKTITAGALPYWITLGPDNEVYFSEQALNKLAQFRYF